MSEQSPPNLLSATTTAASRSDDVPTSNDSKQQKSLRYKLLGDDSNDPIDELKTPFPCVVGHRGALYEYLENTVDSFLQCAKWKCGGVEMDVFVLKESGNTPVVFHGNDKFCDTTQDGDENEGKATIQYNKEAMVGGLHGYCSWKSSDHVQGNENMKRSILDCNLEELQTMLQFNSDFAEFPCPTDRIVAAKIPTLEKVLTECHAVHPDMQFLLELKGPDTVQPVLQLVERLQLTHVCKYSSFDLPRLAQLRKLRPSHQHYPTGALFTNPVPEDFIQQSLQVGATEVHLPFDACTKTRIQMIHDANLSSMAWWFGPRGMQRAIRDDYCDDMVDEDAKMYKVVGATGVQNMCVNKPNVLLDVIEQTK